MADAAAESLAAPLEGAVNAIERYASPWQAAGIGAVAGFVIGVLLSRK